MNLEGSTKLLAECLEEILQRPVLKVAVRQRAKFEGWLKLELAYALEQRGAVAALEVGVGDGHHRSDIQVSPPGGGTIQIMLKTVNTNFRFPGVESRHRPITRNFKGIVEDAVKLRTGETGDGFLVFPVFPVSSDTRERDWQLKEYLDRLTHAGCDIVHTGFIVPPFSNRSWGIAWFVLAVNAA